MKLVRCRHFPRIPFFRKRKERKKRKKKEKKERKKQFRFFLEKHLGAIPFPSFLLIPPPPPPPPPPPLSPSHLHHGLLPVSLSSLIFVLLLSVSPIVCHPLWGGFDQLIRRDNLESLHRCHPAVTLDRGPPLQSLRVVVCPDKCLL